MVRHTVEQDAHALQLDVKVFKREVGEFVEFQFTKGQAHAKSLQIQLDRSYKYELAGFASSPDKNGSSA
jgi:hypothetical protein